MKKILSICAFLFVSLGMQAQDALNMTLLGNFNIEGLPMAGSRTYNDVWGYVDCEGNEYALLGSAAFIFVVDLSDPANPREVNRFAGVSPTTWRDMKTYKDVAYAVADNLGEGLMILDLSGLPNEVTQISADTTDFQSSHNIFVDVPNGRLYVAGSNAQRKGLIVYDLTCDARNPEKIAAVDLPAGEYVHDLYVRDNIAYCSHGYNGFYVWDMNDAQNPVLMASLETGGYNHSNWLTEDGRYAIYAEEIPLGEALGVIDLAEVSTGDISTVNEFKFPLLAPEFENATPHNPYIRGDYLISSYYEDGLQIYDISNPLEVEQVAYYDTHPDNVMYNGYTGNWGAYPYLPSGNILASDINTGLYVLQADNITLAPVLPENDIVALIESTESLFLCEGEESAIIAEEGYDSYQWFRDGTPISGANESTLLVSLEGEYIVTTGSGSCAGNSCPVFVEVFETATAVPIDVLGNELTVSAVGEAYQWFLDGTEITGATEQTYTATESGDYNAIVTTEMGCFITSEVINFQFTGIQTFSDHTSINVYPTLTVNEVWIDTKNQSKDLTLRLFNVNGTILDSQVGQNIKFSFDLQNYPAGLYFIEISNGQERIIEKIVKR